jgi:hypothetical protein
VRAARMERTRPAVEGPRAFPAYILLAYARHLSPPSSHHCPGTCSPPPTRPPASIRMRARRTSSRRPRPLRRLFSLCGPAEAIPARLHRFLGAAVEQRMELARASRRGVRVDTRWDRKCAHRTWRRRAPYVHRSLSIFSCPVFILILTHFVVIPGVRVCARACAHPRAVRRLRSDASPAGVSATSTNAAARMRVSTPLRCTRAREM